MARKKKVNVNDLVRYEQRCKVCNSHFRDVIENLCNEGLNPRQIFEYLNSLNDATEKQIFEKEGLKEATIRRHLERHYDIKLGTKIRMAHAKARVQKSRDNFRTGVAMRVDSISTISHLIDLALINIEELDSFPDGRQRHQLTINYMGQIKSLIDEFSKLTGELKQEGTIDVNFFSAQVNEFAQIVMATISKMDERFNLNSQLIYEFGTEFTKQFKQYKDIQRKILSGELPPNYGEKERTINTFNDVNRIKDQNGTTYSKPNNEFDTTAQQLLDRGEIVVETPLEEDVTFEDDPEE